MQLRVKQDPKLFAEVWHAQMSNRQYVACARMLESCILAQNEHNRVAIDEIVQRIGTTIPELARMLTDAGGIPPSKVTAACPDSDAAKSTLVAEMMTCSREAIAATRCEDKHPFVLTMAFVNEVAHSPTRYDARKRTFVTNV